mmetsp:Transcript_18541/g.31045  ORF Transcript_18541/g.31045 Transcript_18541/m.31045 type:complete len:188 (-) Transcript_18541:1180-1743(-)|eukprot:CAMPEP_0175013646 /NCGR_PEP_ID=MMETSP0005-20121125/10050_1 /TAXON_ID=420556 /ORGANISM="Ochromonas sp., Strain CCMP1393" /LENGTH=187 /DNA_ID=CAMNT_0016270157 /DNA_START=176 /DNA_END=739 /DNA_ORIENTATION=+
MLPLTVLICFSLCGTISGFSCSFPPPDENFTNKKYEGKWYEIGKIQTKGGAFFERNCVCTQLGIEITNPTTGDGIADNDCRYKEVDGRWTNVTGKLTNEDMTQPGKWLESIGSAPPVNYTVISIGDDYSVEYDCGTSDLGITNYCIHVMSRTPTMDSDKFDELVQMAEDMGLNPQELEVKMTKQEGC